MLSKLVQEQDNASVTGVPPASRPCEWCNQHTGETPVPLPSENQLAEEKPNKYLIDVREFPKLARATTFRS